MRIAPLWWSLSLGALSACREPTPPAAPSPPTPVAAPALTPLLGNLSDPEDAAGCGCAFRFADEKRNKKGSVMFWETGDVATVNLSGKDVDFQRQPGSGVPGAVGSKFLKVYTREKARMTLDLVVTRVCAPNDEDCESTGYDATLTVEQEGKKDVAQLKGDCGC